MNSSKAGIILLTSALALTSACAEINSIRSGIGMYGQQASDGALHDSLWAICKASPVGAIKRKFNTPKKMVTYNQLCSNQELLSETE